MSKKKSLGSSPIGYSAIGTSTSTFHFIPELDVEEREEPSASYSASTSHSSEGDYQKRTYRSRPADRDEEPEKKIASYYIEVNLINRLKTMADEEGTYYSTLVGEAIEHWVEIHGY